MEFGYTVVFVADVEATVAFYEAAFGAKRKFVSQAFGMLDTGSTTLAFGWEENEKRELGEAGSDLTFRANRAAAEPAGVQISFITENVEAD